MNILSLLVYVGDVWVIGTYTLLALGKIKVRPFHWANAGAGVPTIIFEVLVHAWPVVPLTGVFCIVGCIGTWRNRHDS
jgi:hypothetical protein